MKFPDWTLPNNRLTASSSFFLSFFFLFFNSYIQLSYFRAVETVRGKSASSLITNGERAVQEFRPRFRSHVHVTRRSLHPLSPGQICFPIRMQIALANESARSSREMTCELMRTPYLNLKWIKNCHANNFFNIKFICTKWNI